MGYRIYPKYSHPLFFTLYFSSMAILLPMNVYKIDGLGANSADPDQITSSATSDLGLHCLLRLAFLNM